MWGTDGVRVFTAEDGWVWTFAAVDHWNAECVGWHVCKVGNRFAALEPVAQGLGRLYGSVEADVARGLALRMDHGSQYLSDHFLNQIRYWGIHPSFGFVEEPETNGVVERWNRTLKEQAVYGRVFRNLAEVRAAVAAFVERYNPCWRLEKLAYRTPSSKRASNTSYAMPRSANVCPRNRVRYTDCSRRFGCRFVAATPRRPASARGVHPRRSLRQQQAARTGPYARQLYKLWVTDPRFERAYLARPNGTYDISECYLTISLGEPYRDACSKLIAAIILAT